jgi:hypothetical protein
MGQVLLTGGNVHRRGVVLLEGNIKIHYIFVFIIFNIIQIIETRFFSLWTVSDLRELKKKVLNLLHIYL